MTRRNCNTPRWRASRIWGRSATAWIADICATTAWRWFQEPGRCWGWPARFCTRGARCRPRRRPNRSGNTRIARAGFGREDAKRLARRRRASGWWTFSTRGEDGQESLGLWALIVSGVNAPEGVEPVEWILLTNVPVNSLEEAAERVDWYACRPIVEEFHKAQKTGCGIENPQFTSKAALEPIIGILSVAAVMLLDLRHQARRPDADKVRATTVMPRLYVRVLSAWRWGKPKINMSIYDCFMALGRLGGHQNRKSDGPPGWLTLWRGWNDLHLMVMGARAAGLEKM